MARNPNVGESNPNAGVRNSNAGESLFDVYRGEQIGAGKKSLAYQASNSQYEYDGRR